MDGGSRDDPYYVGANRLSSEQEACMGTGREETEFQPRKHGGNPLLGFGEHPPRTPGEELFWKPGEEPFRKPGADLLWEPSEAHLRRE